MLEVGLDISILKLGSPEETLVIAVSAGCLILDALPVQCILPVREVIAVVVDVVVLVEFLVLLTASLRLGIKHFDSCTAHKIEA